MFVLCVGTAVGLATNAWLELGVPQRATEWFWCVGYNCGMAMIILLGYLFMAELWDR